jgi:DNA repair exonuclease SbcCD ATPase subunit
VSAVPDPVDLTRLPGGPEISAVAQQARERLHEEIERVKLGVEEMLDEDSGDGGSDDIRRELAELRVETRDYVKRKVRKSEKRLERSLREMDARTDQLERRVDKVEQEREQAEWRIHTNTESMLDGLLREVRVIADRLTKQPQVARKAPPAPKPAARRPTGGR